MCSRGLIFTLLFAALWIILEHWVQGNAAMSMLYLFCPSSFLSPRKGSRRSCVQLMKTWVWVKRFKSCFSLCHSPSKSPATAFSILKILGKLSHRSSVIWFDPLPLYFLARSGKIGFSSKSSKEIATGSSKQSVLITTDGPIIFSNDSTVINWGLISLLNLEIYLPCWKFHLQGLW